MFKTTIGLLLCGVILSGCIHNSSKSTWVETTGRITNVTMLDDGTFGYTLVYNVNESSALNAQGKLIKGIIPQHFLDKQKKPLSEQKLKMRYLRKEPIVFELLDNIRYVSVPYPKL